MFFAWLSKYGVVDTATRASIDGRYASFLIQYSRYFSDATTLDNSAQPLVALLRSQAWISYIDTLPLTSARKSGIAEVIGLQEGPGRKKRAIWDNYGVLIIENNQFDEPQLTVLASLLDEIPPGLANLRFVTARDFLSAIKDYRPAVVKGQTGGGGSGDPPREQH